MSDNHENIRRVLTGMQTIKHLAQPASRLLRDRLGLLIESRGLPEVAEDLFVPASTLARLASGARVRQATEELVRRRLGELLEDEAKFRSEKVPGARRHLSLAAISTSNGEASSP